jgi:hypothetical protein
MTEYGFESKLAFSRGIRESTDLETIRAMIVGCTTVVKADVDLDRVGIDYIATLRRGRQIYIDAKAREAGCSQYWRNGPELALELWSVVPENGADGRVGWTLDEAKQTELVLFTFDPSDHESCYLVSFQLLRMAFHTFLHEWRLAYPSPLQKTRHNGGVWHSQCVFVPVPVVYEAINDVSVWNPSKGVQL